MNYANWNHLFSLRNIDAQLSFYCKIFPSIFFSFFLLLYLMFSLVWQIQSCRRSNPGLRQGCAPAPLSSSTSPALLPATSSQLLPSLLVPATPVYPTMNVPDISLSKLQGVSSVQRLPGTSPPPLSACVLFVPLTLLPLSLYRWQVQPPRHGCPLIPRQSFLKLSPLLLPALQALN